MLLTAGCLDNANDRQAVVPSEPAPVAATMTEETSVEQTNQAAPTGPDTSADALQPEPFAMKTGDHTLALMSWDDEIDLRSLLGEPVNEKIEELKGDGFTGCLLKTLTYDGLELELFSPNNPARQAYWVMTMRIWSADFATAQNITIGDSRQKLAETYPNLHTNDTNPDNAEYELADQDAYKYIRFNVKDGKVAEIRIFHLIP